MTISRDEVEWEREKQEEMVDGIGEDTIAVLVEDTKQSFPAA